MITSLSLKIREAYPQVHAALSSKELWSPKFALFAFINYLIAVLALDILAQPSNRWPWNIFSESVALVCLYSLGLVIRFVLFRVVPNQHPGAALNCVLILFLAVTKNVVVSLLVNLHDTFDLGRLIRDIFNGLLAGVFIGGLFVAIFSAQLFYYQKLIILEQKRRELERSLSNYDTDMVQHRNSLKGMANDALKARFEEIASALGRGKVLSKIVEKLKVAIDNGVLPLIGDFNETTTLAREEAELATAEKVIEPIRLRPEFRLDARPVATWLAASITLCVLVPFINPDDGLLHGALAAISLSILIWWAKNINFITNDFRLTILAIAILNGTISAGYSSGFSFGSEFVATLFLVTVAGGGIQAIFMIGSSVDRASSLLVNELEQTVQGLQKVTRLLQRDRWIEQQKWAKLLHGKVQAILTACIIQISSTNRHSNQLRAEIESSLAKALAILQSAKFRKVNFALERKQMTRAWAGVCALKIEIEAEIEDIFRQDVNLEYVCNLAIKEITSAAFSLFASRSVTFTFFTNKFNQVELRADCENEIRLEESTREQLASINFLASTLQENHIAGKVILSVTFESNARLLA